MFDTVLYEWRNVVTRLLVGGMMLAGIGLCVFGQDAVRSGGDIPALEAALAQVAQSEHDPGALAFRTNFPLARLQLKKAALARSQTYYGTRAVGPIVGQGLAALDRLQRGEPWYARKGELTECAYISENDGTVQPYYLYLPKAYDPQQQWPLIVFLHGYVPTISVLQPWVLGEEICRIADKHGCMLLIPYGRRNTDFQGVGEVDVLVSTEEVKSLYSVDPLRIYISGVSMGGMGAWNIALRHPGMYAAATPISGQTDMHVWWPRMLPGWPRSRDDLAPFRRLLVEWDNPVDLAQNARNQNIFVQHGERDHLIPVEQSRTIVKAAASLGIPIRMYEFEGASHYIYWETPCFENAWGWSKQFTLDSGPKHITYKTYSLEYDTAFWLTVADFLEWGIAATVDCRVEDDGSKLSLNTTNVAKVRIDLGAAPLADPEKVSVVVNGRDGALVHKNGVGEVVCVPVAARAESWPPRKRKGLCGPVEEVFDTRFIVVIGTTGDQEANALNAANATRWAREWDEFADGLPRVQPDREITDQDIATSNLVLFGTPASNSVLARLAEKLPVQIGDRKYTLAGRTYEGDDLGLVMCYPNPLAPDRYVAIYAGTLYGAKCGINHKHDLIPDFIVFKGQQFSFDDTNEHVVAGYFDMNWQLCEKLTWIRQD